MTNEDRTVNPRLAKIMCRDADKGITTIKEALAHGNVKLFTTTVHGLKAALANFGEKAASEYARKLEKAGGNEDLDYINDKIDPFIEMLKDIITRFTPEEVEDTTTDVIEDVVFLKEQLQNVQTACEDYDDLMAYKILDRICEKAWKLATNEALEEIRETLYLHSDFEVAAAKAVNLMNKFQ